MRRISFRFFLMTAPALFTACAPRPGVPAHVLEAADPSAAEARYVAPDDPLDDRRPRSLDLRIPDPAAVHRPEEVPEIGTPTGHDHHSGHGTATPTATPTPTPRPAIPGPTRTPGAPTPTPSPAHGDRPGNGERAVYTCPMHPEVRETRAGSCPKCGMALQLRRLP